MKTATYTLMSGEKKTIEYDENAPCVVCGLPIKEASTSGTNLCPWCDCGTHRDGTKWTYKESYENMKKWHKHLTRCRHED